MNYKLCDQEEFDSRPCCALSRIFISAPIRLVVVAMLGTSHCTASVSVCAWDRGGRGRGVMELVGAAREELGSTVS